MPGSGDPYCSLVNVATAHDGSPLLLISKLAIHTKNILADPRASLMLDERKPGDPLEGARVMLMGRVAATDDAKARARYLARQPEAEMFAGFPDFAILPDGNRACASGRRLRAHRRSERGRTFSPKSPAPRRYSKPRPDAVAHMNEDHKDALQLYATKLLGAPDGEWRCTGCDPEGLELQHRPRRPSSAVSATGECVGPACAPFSFSSHRPPAQK